MTNTDAPPGGSRQEQAVPSGHAIPEPDHEAAPITVGDLTIDRDRFLVTVGSRPVPLTYMEFRVLYLIARSDGRVARYDDLSVALWSEAGPQTRRRLAVLVSRIRSKLGGAAGYVDTVQRVGYRMAMSAT